MVFFAFLLIFWVGFGVEAVEDSFCSATDTAPVYIPHKEDCSKYWQCSNGKAYLQNCPNDTHFNSILNVCDFPETAGCIGGHGNNSNTGNDGDESFNGDGDEKNDSDNGTQICLQSGIECPAVDGEELVYGALPVYICQCSPKEHPPCITVLMLHFNSF
ncbi:hypothetical protein JTB14_028372 [Gonioctena quinquepunctata]|nr:hypothetical protein JTB14_028372 [Gonioctena quinquepunctata]